MARNVAKIMQEEKLFPVVISVINKPGASGVIGYSYTVQKKGDPHYMVTIGASYWTAPLVGQSPLSFRDFVAVGGLGSDTFMLVTRVQSPYKTFQDVIDTAKKNPGLLTVSVPNVASDDSVVCRMLERAAGIKFNVINFGGGGGQPLMAALGGHVDFTWPSPAEVLPQIEAKKVRVLAVASGQRMKQFPDVPTLKELGYDVEFYQLRGLVMPKEAPSEARKILGDAVYKLCTSKRWQTEYVDKYVISGVCQGPDDFGKAIINTNDLYKVILADLGVIKK